MIPPSTQDANLVRIRLSEDVLDVIWTSNVRSIYVLCPGRLRFLQFIPHYYIFIN